MPDTGDEASDPIEDEVAQHEPVEDQAAKGEGTSGGDDEVASGTSVGRLARRYGPFVAVAAIVTAAVVVFRGGDDDDQDTAAEAVTDREELVLSGPTTPEKAERLDEDFEYGPRCDPETDRIKLPTVYAPPCVEPFDGDNGRDTAQGVTGDTIKLVAYHQQLSVLTGGVAESTGADLDAQRERETIQGFVDLYNEVFETYGRRVEVEYFTATGAADDHAVAKADAISIAEREPFAVIGGPSGASPTFADELAAQGILCLEPCAVGLSREFIEDLAPHVYQGAPTPWAELTAEAAGKLAAPGKAEMAGSTALRKQDRVYAFVYYETPDASGLESFDDALADEGIPLEVTIPFTLDPNRIQENARTIISQLQAADVTTVIIMPDPLTPKPLTEEATAQGYFPEWILGNNYLAGTAQFARTFDQQQWGNGFGVVVGDASADGLSLGEQLYEWGHGTAPPNNSTAGTTATSLLTLFTGIHLAGPELAPETFRDGLYRYPPSGGGPTRPRIDWLDGGNVALVWWDPKAEGIDESGVEGLGMHRFANGGQRYALGEIPDTVEAAGLFDEGSSVIEYDELPPEDQAPDYPSPLG